jgi:GT2 family glycosyltransferase
MKPEYDVAVILVGLNAKDFVVGCLRTLESAVWRDVTHEVIYVDNGSSDGSADVVREAFPAVQVIENASNVGFCPAANQGARAVSSRYYYFINDDTEVVEDAIALLVEYMDEHPNVGTCGSRLLFPDGTEQYSGRKFPNAWSAILGRRSFLSRYLPNLAPLRDYLCKDELNRGEPFSVDWVSAAGQIVRPDAFSAIGGFAENYYYWHEAIFCHRLTQKGFDVVLHPGSRVIHYEGHGSGVRSPKIRRFHVINFHRGAYRCYSEYYGLRWFNPLRWLVAVSLFARGAMLWFATFVPRLSAG